jgi:hypothetical protein
VLLKRELQAAGIECRSARFERAYPVATVVSPWFIDNVGLPLKCESDSVVVAVLTLDIGNARRRPQY